METNYYIEEGRLYFPQVSKSAARSKWNRMLSGAGRFGSCTLEVGFSNWEIREDCGSWVITAHSTYHVESSLVAMYKTNFKR